MMDFETALDPGCEMYAHDITADKSLTGEVTAAIDLSVDRMKDLLRRNAFDSNAGMLHALCRIGQLLEMKNRLTGEKTDLEYLLCDDNECLFYVAGFIGDPAGVSDVNGTPLRVGDTVMCQAGSETYEQMIILGATGCSALSQDWLEGKRAVFRTDCAESDIAAAQRYSYPSIGRRSCLKDYHAGRERQQARKRPRRLPREER